ncbi:class I SAM-dependent methyltransferase [Actinoplanes sp. TBRC 11911]|uniref:class I SAM-dependent methyltransferase n=1 Tax=Actinoplanes sp. TBRC 11911 TaxID=2729386 RepID=UPI00145F7C9C|nr:class I SAM-dependent methyltransferase [Actinoplanes sp. TBRC 11911]NMO51237.1 class I SAM-dependent methyltransferase [Actinoplanes sp. TBRC 11911]
MSAYLTNADIYQESWDRQQLAFMPDREERFGAMLNAVAAVTDGAPPRLLDLAGGTGSIALRTLARFPGARVTVLDQDPVLLAIATASLRERGTIVDADLSDPAWRSKLSEDGFDAVLTATALHWLPAERVATLYGEIREVLRPGGIFANADHMPEESLPGLSERLRSYARGRRDARYAAGAATSWTDWWKLVAADDFLAEKVVERNRIYPLDHHSTEWTPPAIWHLDALRVAGFTEAGVLWRGGTDAAVVGVR